MSKANWQGYCWHCAQQLNTYDYQRENRCPQCSKATHCCHNCIYFKPGIANSCRETIADYVSDKDRANFCDYFSPANEAPQDTAVNSADQIQQDAEDLFS